MFSEASPEDLLVFLHDELRLNGKLRKKFLDQFTLNAQHTSKQSIRLLIQRYLKGSLITRRSAAELTSHLEAILEEARILLSAENWRDGTDLLMAIIDEVTLAGWQIDDSTGRIGQQVLSASDLLQEIFKTCENPGIKDDILSFAFRLSQSSKHQPWDVDQKMFDFLIHQTWSDLYIEKLKQVCFEQLSSNKEQYLESSLVNKVLLAARADGDEVLYNDLLESYAHLPFVIQLKYEDALAKNNPGTAWQIGETAIQSGVATHDLRAVLDWQKKLFALAQEVNDTNAQKKYAHQIYISQPEHDAAIFSVLRRLHQAHWLPYRERLLKELQGESQPHLAKQAAIFAKEELDQELLSLMQEHPQYVLPFGSHLQHKYPTEVLEIHRLRLERNLKDNTGRKFYRRFCSDLSQIAQEIDGGEAFTKGMIIRIRQEYRQRKALVAELDRLADALGLIFM